MAEKIKVMIYFAPVFGLVAVAMGDHGVSIVE